MPHLPARRLAVGIFCVLVAGCGATSHSAGVTEPATSTATASQTTTATTPAPTLAAAEAGGVAGFPRADGRQSLQSLADGVAGTASFGAATGTFTPGRQRVAFAITSKGQIIYAPTVLYVATKPGAPASGPFPAPADPMTVAPRYRSAQYLGPGDIEAIYHASVPFPHPGSYVVLAMSRTSHGLVGSPGMISVAPNSPIPAPGQRAPDIATDTLASTHGSVALLTTRKPPESMHSVSLDQALGRRPVALLFSTPQLCVSRVCGPVTDVLVSLQHEFAGRITFIHEEVYVGNDPAKGLRPQMTAFHLQTEPWLFTIDRHGIIAARLEGAFGVREARAALLEALR